MNDTHHISSAHMYTCRSERCSVPCSLPSPLSNGAQPLTHRCAFNAEHPVDAVWATAIPTPPCRLALAHHHVVFVLHLPLAMRQNVLLYQLPNGGHATPASPLLLELVLQRTDRERLCK